MKITAKPGQVRLIEGQPQPKKRAAVPKTGPAPTLHLERRASSELDIRGYETLEAESVVENYLDAAVMAKLETVTRDDLMTLTADDVLRARGKLDE